MKTVPVYLKLDKEKGGEGRKRRGKEGRERRR
jgi:hypothetical protein